MKYDKVRAETQEGTLHSLPHLHCRTQAWGLYAVQAAIAHHTYRLGAVRNVKPKRRLISPAKSTYRVGQSIQPSYRRVSSTYKSPCWVHSVHSHANGTRRQFQSTQNQIKLTDNSELVCEAKRRCDRRLPQHRCRPENVLNIFIHGTFYVFYVKNFFAKFLCKKR